MESLRRSLVSLRRRYTVFVNGIPHEEFGISQTEGGTLYICITCQLMDPSRGVWHLSERGTLYLCIACKWNPSKGVWHPSERGTIYLSITCITPPL